MPRSHWTSLDRIVTLEPGKPAVGLRNVANTLAIFDSHFPRFPVLPGVIILGTMGELAGLLLAEQTGERWRLAGAERVRYRHFVRPGDQMEVTVDLKDLSDDVALFGGDAKVDGKSVTTARQLRMVPAKG